MHHHHKQPPNCSKMYSQMLINKTTPLIQLEEHSTTVWWNKDFHYFGSAIYYALGTGIKVYYYFVNYRQSEVIT